jgi:cold shock protein
MLANVKHFNSEKGYGFLTTEDGDLFVHISQINGQELHKGDTVSYDVVQGRKGLEAANVTVVEFAKN